MTPWKQVVAEFREKLKEKNCTIRDFALERGYRVQTFRNYLSGESPAPEKVVQLVREYLK